MKRDLFVVVADLDAENVIRTLFEKRQKALGIDFDFNPSSDLLRFYGRDAGCLRNAVELLRVAQKTHKHALLLFDHHGSGHENKAYKEIESEIERKLIESGWNPERIAVIIFAPELEAWVWSDSTQMAETVGWNGDLDALRKFIRDKDFIQPGETKPDDPKAAMRSAMRFKRVPCTARVFSELATKVSLKGCADVSFHKFSLTLSKWFSMNIQ